MITISLCMIAKNEEDVIARCLDSVKDIVDEIVIVDTGSTDKTKEIVKNYTDKIFDFKWIDDFGAARNYSFSKATKEYILWIDCDDVFIEEDRQKLMDLKKNLDPSVDSVTFKYNYFSDENGNPLLIFRRERLVKRIRNFQWVGFIHEYIAAGGNMIDADITVTHKRIHGSSDRNLNIYKKKISEGHKLSVRDMYYYGKELFYHGMWNETIETLEPFMNMDSWVEDKIDAACKLSECYQYTGNIKKEREALYRSFEFTAPRGETMYRLAQSFEREGRLHEAIFWYNTILNTEMPKECHGFINPEYWTWKPHLQLCVCYYRIGEIDKSNYHHQMAYKINPNDPIIKKNEEFFQASQREKNK